MKKDLIRTMHRKIALLSASAVLFASFSPIVPAQEQGQGDSVPFRLAAFNPIAPPADEQKPLTWKDVNSGAFQKIMLISGVGRVQIGMLYQTSGAKDFKEFSLAFVVARNLRLDPQVVLRALWSQSLKEILNDFGFPNDQAKRTLKIAKDQLENANKDWKAGRPVQ
jgi:hypothetical protein